ncbi:MAG: PASTA domain-containing protein [Phycisphaerales bacterium]|nr:MAG: PASTA domain-containing protein [Phycisphaerales bacterium]
MGRARCFSLLRKITVAVAVLLGPVTAQAKIIYVDDDAAGANDGSSWESAYKFLQEALADANSAAKPVEIRVAQGVYTPDSNSAVPNGAGDREATFQLIKGVILRGGFAGGELDVRDVEAYKTILSGDLDGNDGEVVNPKDLREEPTRAENSYHVVTGSGTDETAVLNGFTITGGNANGPVLGDESPDPYRLQMGGGMYNSGGSPTLTGCNFGGNSAKYGGGIYNYQGNPNLSNCIFSGNYAERNAGGIYNSKGSPNLSDCTLSGNYAERNAGGMYNYDRGPTVTNCTFSGNYAEERGGGMFNYQSSLTVTNCSFTGNSAGSGGGMFNYQSSPTLINCILRYNTPDQTLNGTITYSNIQGGWEGMGNIDTDPCFVDPGHWGHEDDLNTVVEPNDPKAVWVRGDYHLKSQAGRYNPKTGTWVKDAVTSPCIDAGDPNSDWKAELWSHGKRINIGAYGGTTQASMSLSAEGDPADCNTDWVVDAEDFLILCEDWLTERLPTAADINRDGAVNVNDYSLLAAKWLHDIFVHVDLVDVPNVVGMTQTDAEAAITVACLTVGTVATVNSNTVPSGDVISQDPAAGTNVTSASAVDMVVSLGPVMLECEVEGYPCSLSEVPIEILERSVALGEVVLAMFERGDSTAEIETWLNEQVDMAEVQADDLTVRFRLDGGRGTWVLREEAFATQSAPGAASSAHRPILQSAVVPLMDSVSVNGVVPFHVVGGDLEPKKALVLSPMQWDLPGNIDGETVSAILASTRGYGSVLHLSNETILEANVNVDSFKGWNGYQVIHVDSHGSLICEEGEPCRALVAFITCEAFFGKALWENCTAEDLATIEEKGVVPIPHKRKNGKEAWELGLEADFFRENYGRRKGTKPLENTLIFFNTCHGYSSQDTDLANALRGSTSVFIGWDSPADINGANATSKKLYEELSEWGYTVETAYNNLGSLKTDGYGHTLIQSGRKAGGDLRIRDVVSLLNPETMLPIPPYDSVAIVGKQGDGEPDAVPYLVQVDGVKKVNSDVLVYVQVDMSVELVQADPQPLSSGTTNEHDQWLVSGVVDLPIDLEEDEEVTIKAWVYLPSGGESNHEVAVTLTGEEEESLVGEWVVDNDSLDVKAIGFELKYVQGEIRATFGKKGNVDVVYDNWEYCVFDWDTDLSIGGIDCMNYEEFTTTIKADGTTTYEVDGDTINFGHYFESDFLEGTQIVHHIKDWTPDVLPDVDRIIEESVTGRDVFVWSPNYELQGSTLRLIFWNHEFILHRRGSADE